MNFKKNSLLLLALCLSLTSFPLGGMGEEGLNGDTGSGTRRPLSGVLRPVIIESNFARSSVKKALHIYASRPGYTLSGAPKFHSIWTRNIGITETALAQTGQYGMELNKLFWKEEVIPNLASYQKILHPETISSFEKGYFGRNPRLKNGELLVWHHDVKRRYQLVQQLEHQQLHHTGGNSLWGEKSVAFLDKKSIFGVTAYRWAIFSGLDFAVETSFLWLSGERSWSPYLVSAGGSITAGTFAWLTESALVATLPNTAAATPYYIMGVPISMGGPASWVAAGVFIASKVLVQWAWSSYQAREAERVEQLCRESERDFRISLLEQRVHENTQSLKALLNS